MTRSSIVQDIPQRSNIIDIQGVILMFCNGHVEAPWIVTFCVIRVT